MKKINNPVLILAGGKGTRIKSVLKSTPKVLAPIGDQHFLYFLIKRLTSIGFKNFVFLLGFKHLVVKKQIENMSKKFDINLSYIIENKSLGTGGAVINAIEELNLKEPFFLTNADTWINGNLKKYLELMKENSILLVKSYSPDRFGTIELDKNSMVKKFVEKTDKSTGYINSGFYFLSPEIFKKFSSPCSLENEIFPSFEGKSILHGMQSDLRLTDIGVPEDYYKFKRSFDEKF